MDVDEHVAKAADRQQKQTLVAVCPKVEAVTVAALLVLCRVDYRLMLLIMAKKSGLLLPLFPQFLLNPKMLKEKDEQLVVLMMMPKRATAVMRIVMKEHTKKMTRMKKMKRMNVWKEEGCWAQHS